MKSADNDRSSGRNQEEIFRLASQVVKQPWAKNAGHKFRGLRAFLLLRWQEEFAQIIDNLVGCSKEELVSTLSKTERYSNSFSSNESLIPAQNQRWRRA